MRHFFLAALSVTALLGAGCSGNSITSPPLVANPTSGGQVSPDLTSGGLLYVASGPNSSWQVTIFDQKGRNQKPIGVITDGIDGSLAVCVDKRGNVYAANVLNGTVTVYAHGTTSPFETLTGAGAPLGVAVDGDLAVYVANVGNINDPSNGSVLKYRKGSTQPSKTIVAFGSKVEPISLALDPSENLFVGVDRHENGSTQGEVIEFVHGFQPGKDLGIRVGHVGGIAIDHNDDLLLVDEDNNSVDVFPPGSTMPSQVITGFPACCISSIALNRDNTKLWVTDGFWGHIFGVTYPGGVIVDTISPRLGWEIGVATSPESQ